MSDRSAGVREDREQDARGILATPLNDQLRFGYEMVHAGTVLFSNSHFFYLKGLLDDCYTNELQKFIGN